MAVSTAAIPSTSWSTRNNDFYRHYCQAQGGTCPCPRNTGSSLRCPSLVHTHTLLETTNPNDDNRGRNVAYTDKAGPNLGEGDSTERTRIIVTFWALCIVLCTKLEDTLHGCFFGGAEAKCIPYSGHGAFVFVESSFRCVGTCMDVADDGLEPIQEVMNRD